MYIEKAKKLLNGIDIKFFLNGTIEQSNYIVDKADETNLAIETVLNELEKKDKVIDLMAEYIVDLIKYNNSEEIRDAEEVKQYFYKKAEDK